MLPIKLAEDGYDILVYKYDCSLLFFKEKHKLEAVKTLKSISA